MMSKNIIVIRFFSLPAILLGVLMFYFVWYCEFINVPTTLTITASNLETNRITASAKYYSISYSCPEAFRTIIQTEDVMSKIIPGYVQLKRKNRIIKIDISLRALFAAILPFILFGSLICFLPIVYLQKRLWLLVWIAFVEIIGLICWPIFITPF